MEIRFLRQPHKFIKRAHKGLKEQIGIEILEIQKKPKIGKALRGKDFKGLRSHHFKYVNVNYRIAYKVENNILIIAIASRENFYRDLRI